MKFNTGDIIAGRYRIDAFHLEGGMQEVYKCFDLTLDRIVALKTPRVGIIDKRFRRGAQMGARVVHPNVAATLDYVEENSNRCMIEEFIDGKDLGKRLLNDFIFLDPSLSAWVLHNIARGLHAAHNVGICHRDLKPSNIMTSANGHMDVIKLTDFGIAKLAEMELEVEIEKFVQDESTLISSNTLLGALPYMAPEAWGDWPNAGQPADIWAFGAIACHLLLGAPPFGVGKGAIVQMVQAQMKGKVELNAPEWFGRHLETNLLEQQLWELVRRCLQVDTSLRPTAEEVVKYCESLCYSAAPRRTGVIEDYPLEYGNGSVARAGFIRMDDGEKAFFHSENFFAASGKPQVGQRVNFGIAAGRPKERCSPVLLVKNQ